MSGGQDRTEKPTHRKRQKARNKGQMAKSPELQSAIMILVGVGVLYAVGPWMKSHIIEHMAVTLSRVAETRVTVDTAPHLFAVWTKWGAMVLAPLFVLMFAVGVASPAGIQGGILWTTSPLSPDLNRLNPINGAKKFFSTRLLFQFGRDVVKIFLIGLVCYFGVREAVSIVMPRADVGLADTLSTVGGTAISMGFKAGLILLVIGLVDLAYQTKKNTDDLKMSKKDVKDEMKDSEGDPLIKAKIRAQQREAARRRMMTAVPTADVVLTNPTHLAVALKYDPENMRAPQVVAKGKRLIAEKIKEIAREHGIPVIEDKPLARSLFRMAPVGAEVPMDLYRAVAEVLSYVYKLKGKKSPLEKK